MYCDDRLHVDVRSDQVTYAVFGIGAKDPERFVWQRRFRCTGQDVAYRIVNRCTDQGEYRVQCVAGYVT